VSYEDRVERRKAEIESLQEALNWTERSDAQDRRTSILCRRSCLSELKGAMLLDRHELPHADDPVLVEQKDALLWIDARDAPPTILLCNAL